MRSPTKFSGISLYIIIGQVMGKCISKPIGSFADYCKSKQTKTINENSQVSIDVPFWDEAINSLIGHIHGIAGEPVSWERLVKYIKTKFIITGRDFPEDDTRLVLAYIADKLFQDYGDAWVDGDATYSYSTAELGSKALVLSTLSDEILHQVKQETGEETVPEPETPNTVAKVYIEDPYEFDDYCGEGRVASYSKFSKLLKESVERITTQDDGSTLDFVLNKIEQAAGSLKLEDILKVVQDEEYEDLEEYVSSIAEERMEDFKIALNGKELVDKNVLKVARKLFSYQVVRDVLDKISKENPTKK